MMGSNINTNNKEAAPKGFEFLHNIGDDPDPAKSKFGSGPLADQGGVDDATIPGNISAPLRTTRPWIPTSLSARARPIFAFTVSLPAVGAMPWSKSKR